MQLVTKEATMTSREIAELVDSRHDDVKRSIDRLVERGVIVQPPMADEPGQDSMGRPRPVSVYLIGKRDSYVIVAQLSPEFTARLVDRWQALEAKQVQTFIVPINMVEALQLALEQAKQIEAQRPKVEFVDRYVEGTGAKGFREVAKLLKANEREFREFLVARKVMYPLAGRMMPYGNHIDAGRFEVKTGQSDDGHVWNQAKFTPKGVEWIAGEWGKRLVQVTQ